MTPPKRGVLCCSGLFLMKMQKIQHEIQYLLNKY